MLFNYPDWRKDFGSPSIFLYQWAWSVTGQSKTEWPQIRKHIESRYNIFKNLVQPGFVHDTAWVMLRAWTARVGEKPKVTPKDRPRISAHAMGLYITLQVPYGADREAITKAFRKRIKEVHPDHGGSSEQFQQVRKAYAELMEKVL